jgi:hypothetical protein
MTILEFPPANSKPQSKEVEVAWHIYCALSQYHAAHPEVEHLPDFGQAVLDAHNHWAMLFVK